MTTDHNAASGTGWPFACEWAIDQVACPAFCCTRDGGVMHSNRSAQRLWGGRPHADDVGRWDGFAALYDAEGMPLPKSISPAARAAETGHAQAPYECIAESADGQRRRLVIHARPVAGIGGEVVGVFCSLTDISERHRLEGELDQAGANRDVFLRILAHELRNPLAPIMTVAQTMGRVATDPRIAQMAGIVERQARQLARFVTDLLDASRIERACDVPVTMRGATVNEVVGLARDVAAAPIRARGQALCIDVDAGDERVPLLCDPERLAQALGNALINASDYSDDGAPIILSARIDGALLEIGIQDRGIGASRHQLRELFVPFRKFAHHPARMPSGAGVGLAIAKSVCDAHGGMVSAHSAGPGRGMCLKFMLPVVDVAASV